MIKKWKITFKDGTVQQESNYDYLIRETTTWVVQENHSSTKEIQIGKLWWKKTIEEESTYHTTVIAIPVVEIHKIEYAEYKD